MGRLPESNSVIIETEGTTQLITKTRPYIQSLATFINIPKFNLNVILLLPPRLQNCPLPKN
jgi:hypothetical protein